MNWFTTVTYGPTGFSQTYYRHIAVHSHPLVNAFQQAALTDAQGRISANLPHGAVYNPVALVASAPTTAGNPAYARNI
jgi:hypothetical protein